MSATVREARGSRTSGRADAREKATGEARYVADLVRPGMLHARFVYAQHPHARIRGIDSSRARAQRGVHAVLTQADVPAVRFGPVVKDRTLFADGLVRYEGEPVAAVAAATLELADRAATLVEVDYEPLEALVDPERALERDAPLVHEQWQSYDCLDGLVRAGNDCGFCDIVKGDPDRALADAHTVLSERYESDMSHAVPIEPHAILAEWQGDRVTIWSTTQVPFGARAGVAETLQLPESAVRIVVPHLGGGFGGKCDFHFEAHVAALARATRRPVKLVFGRREEFIVPDKARQPMVIELTTGLDDQGRIVARTGRIIQDQGAYASDGPPIGEIATMMAAGPYRIPNLRLEANTVYTHRTPMGSVRAPGGPGVCWAVEQHTDALARQTGLDPLEFRLRNLVQDGDEGPTGQRLAAVGVRECVARSAELAGYHRERAAREGIGLACGWWFSMPGPSGARVSVNPDGSATIITGAQENGSGAVMALPALASAELGIAAEEISILYQDTDAGPFDGGSSGSQTTFNNGRAVIAAARQIAEQLKALAGERLEVDREAVSLEDGLARVNGDPERSVPIAELAAGAQDAGRLLIGSASPAPPPMPESFGAVACRGRVIFPAFAAPSFFCHAARVRVDHETGVVSVREVTAVHDFGRVLNPTGAEGQVEGGIVNGIGIALSEGTSFDGPAQANPHLLDYKLQTAADAPRITVSFVDAPAADGGPLGGKGVGEPPIVPTAGAVANAIAEVVGVHIRRLPMTPPRVWSAILDGG